MSRPIGKVKKMPKQMKMPKHPGQHDAKKMPEKMKGGDGMVHTMPVGKMRPMPMPPKQKPGG